MNFLLYVLSVLGIVLFIYALDFLDKRFRPSMFKKIQKAVIELQRKAIDNVIPKENKGCSLDFMSNLAATVKRKLSLVYTVSQVDEGFLHTVSSKMKGIRDEEFHIECLLHIILILQRELEQIGISPEEADIQFEESELGTLYVYMFLTPGEHKRLSKKIKGTLTQIEMPISPLNPGDYIPNKNKKKKTKQVITWKEPVCETIKKSFNVENLRDLLEDGAKESDAEFTHQQIADWCRLWSYEINNDQLDAPEEIRDLVLDVDMQWDMNLFNTYSIEELNELDFSQLKLPYEWFEKWAAKLNNFTEQSARL